MGARSEGLRKSVSDKISFHASFQLGQLGQLGSATFRCWIRKDLGYWCFKPRYCPENAFLGQVTIPLKSLLPNGLNCHLQLSEVDNTRVFWLFPQEFHGPRRRGGGHNRISKDRMAVAKREHNIARGPISTKISGATSHFLVHAETRRNWARKGIVQINES